MIIQAPPLSNAHNDCSEVPLPVKGDVQVLGALSKDPLWFFCCSGRVLLERVSSITRKPYLYLLILSPLWWKVLLSYSGRCWVIQLNYFMPLYILNRNHLVTNFGSDNVIVHRTKGCLNNFQRNLKSVLSLRCVLKFQPWNEQIIFCVYISLQASKFCWRRSKKWK